MIARVERLRLYHPVICRSDFVLRNRLLNACRDVKACRLAIPNPADTVQGVIAALQSAIAPHTQAATAAPTSPSWVLQANPLVNIVDRRFRKWKPKKHCYVCGKPGGFSAKHTAEERVVFLHNYRRRTTSHATDVPVGDDDP